MLYVWKCETMNITRADYVLCSLRIRPIPGKLVERRPRWYGHVMKPHPSLDSHSSSLPRIYSTHFAGSRYQRPQRRQPNAPDDREQNLLRRRDTESWPQTKQRTVKELWTIQGRRFVRFQNDCSVIFTFPRVSFKLARKNGIFVANNGPSQVRNF